VGYQQPPDDRADVAAGWYPDAGGLQALRWWDGAQWTGYTQPLPEPQLRYPDAAAGTPEGYSGFGQESAGRHRQRRDLANGAMVPPGLYPASLPAAEAQQADPYQPRQDLNQPPGRPTQQLPAEPAGDDYPPGPGVPRHTPGSAPRRHRVRNTLIASAAGLVLLLAGISIGSAGKTANPAPASTVTVTAAAAPAPAVTVTRTARAAGRGATASASAPASVPADSSAAAQSSGVLFTFSGSGIRNSASFTVDSSVVTVRYSYDCSAFGGSGNFIADLVSGSPSSESYDDQSIANQLGSGDSQTTTIYPQDQGSSYHLEVNSECSWSITLTAG
jgi:Protein of unknown function (DUF2510)